MGELILHIGTRKTGTTSLQRFLFDNREALAANGVDLVQFTPQHKEAYTTHRNGLFLKKYCLALMSNMEISSQISDFEENYRRLSDALKGGKRVLLSDEDFSAITNRTYNKELDPEEFWRTLNRVIDELGVKSTTIIVYLRRQDGYMISHWKEMVKGGYTDLTFREYVSRPEIKCELDYKSMLDVIRNSFGPSAKIIVRSYDRASASSGGIYQDFCEAMGIEWDSDYILPKRRLNESFSFDMAEALRTCKYGGDGRSEAEKWTRRSLAAALCRHRPDPKGTTIFLPGEAEAFMAQCLDGNRRIEEEYFGSKSLFSDEYNEGTVWCPDRIRIAIYRAAFLCPNVSKTLCSVSRRIRNKMDRSL